MEDGKDVEWWIPETKIDAYELHKSIADFDKFEREHIREDDFYFDETVSKQYLSFDGNFNITVVDQIIESAACYNIFLVGNINAIGSKLKDFEVLLKMRFGESIAGHRDESVLYENGDIETDIDYEEISLFVTVDENDIIVRCSVY